MENTKITVPSDDIQLRVFGFIDPQEPIPGTIKATAYAVLSDPSVSDEIINALAAAWQRMRQRIEKDVIGLI